ncbi:MAG: hypothetical protein ACKOWF_05480, partial [Chloroflexota bacterium]
DRFRRMFGQGVRRIGCARDGPEWPMFCTACAQVNDPGAAACRGCGALLRRVPPLPARRSGPRRAIIWIAPAVAALLALAVVAGDGARQDREARLAVAAAIRAGDASGLPLDVPQSHAGVAAALQEAERRNAGLRSTAISRIAAGDLDGAAATLRQAVRLLPSDRDARDQLAAVRWQAIGARRADLESASLAADPLAIDRAARGLAALLDGSPEAAALRDRADHSAPVVLARDAALWLVAPDGGDGRMLTDNVPVARPVWNSQRSRIAFVSSAFSGPPMPATLFIIDADGSNLRPVYGDAHPNAVPSWSPDGARIALTSVADWSLSAETGRLAVHIVSLAGAPPDLDISASIGAHATTPSWSPDGRSVAFIARPFRDDPTASALAGPASVMLWSSDGAVRDLTGDALTGANRLLWTRDGRSLIVLSRDSVGSGATTGAMSSIAAIDIATGRIDLIDDAIPTSSSGWGPASSPDGRLAWVAGARTVVIRDPAGGESFVDTGRLLSGALSWAPGGGQLLAVAAEPGRPSARITLDPADPAPVIDDADLRYDLEWPTGTPQWSPLLDDPQSPSAAAGRGGAGLDS